MFAGFCKLNYRMELKIMNEKKLINEIIYFFKYFKMLEIDDNEKIIISKELASRLESFIFLKNIAEMLQGEMQLKKSINAQIKKRLDVLFAELENRKIMLEKEIDLQLANQ